MSERVRRKTASRATTVKAAPVLSANRIKAMMRAAAKGAAELDNKMKPLFQLSDRSASLRFK